MGKNASGKWLTSILNVKECDKKSSVSVRSQVRVLCPIINHHEKAQEFIANANIKFLSVWATMTFILF